MAKSGPALLASVKVFLLGAADVGPLAAITIPKMTEAINAWRCIGRTSKRAIDRLKTGLHCGSPQWRSQAAPYIARHALRGLRACHPDGVPARWRATRRNGTEAVPYFAFLPQLARRE